ncbi:DUF523 domain-containing protein [Oceanobacter antarcticus]|uniref:DUF523 domain-containing protein n=1 Tax=Oceanobacter antarcticus TaxID=3133425 RepID=A0ABW8NMR7_9GAMM
MKILVSACLLGQRVRYDGADNAATLTHQQTVIEQWHQQGWLIPVCPEVAGGLPVPRSAAEIAGGNGAEVLAGQRRVVTQTGDDVTEFFLAGARHTLAYAQTHNAKAALLAARSPSCGPDSTYDGSFSKQLTAYSGITATLLKQHGIVCFSPDSFEQLLAWVQQQQDWIGPGI